MTTGSDTTDAAGIHLVGYTDRMNPRAGESIWVMVSSRSETYVARETRHG